jgi:signal transduction histidine kinase/PAS domain-containing protein/ActR/RegA family two-component response regulator
MKTECAMDQTAAEFEQLMNVSNVAIVKIDLKTLEAVQYNDTVCSILGITREECEAAFHHDMKKLFAGKYQQQLKNLKKEIASSLAKGKKNFSIDMEMPTASGSVWIGGTASFCDYDPKTKKPRYINAVYRDITEIIKARRKEEQAKYEEERSQLLQEHAKEIQRMLQAVPTGLGAVRIENGIPETKIYLNKYFVNHMGMKRDANGLVSLDAFQQCIKAEERQLFRNDFHHFLTSHHCKGCEYHFLLKNGQYAWFHMHGSIQTVSEDTQIAYFVFTNIDEQKCAEASLKENQKQYQKTVDAMNVRMWTYDIPNRCIHMADNAATLSFLKKNGLPKIIENVPDGILRSIDPADRSKLLAMYDKVNNGKDASCEVWYQMHAGIEPSCQKQSYHVIKDADGTPIKAYGIARDITAERKIQELYAREMKYLHSNSDDSLLAKGHANLTKNRLLNYENCNSSTRDDLDQNLSYDESCAILISMISGDDDQKRIRKLMTRESLIRRNQGGETQTAFQFRKEAEGKNAKWISVTVHTYTSPETGDVELFSYAYDITEKMLLETVMNRIAQDAIDLIALINVKNNTIELVRKAPKIVYPEIHQIVDFDDYRTYACKKYLRDEEQRFIFKMTSMDHVLKLMNSKREHTVTFQAEEKCKIRCKQLDLMWFDPNHTTVLLVRTDITPTYDHNQKQLEKIEAARQEAERANQAKSVFVSNMSHDLRTPLNGVMGFIDLAMQEKDQTKKQEYLQKSDSSAKLLLDIVNDILELSRIENGKVQLEEQNVNEMDLIPSIVESLIPSAEQKNIKIDADYSYIQDRTICCDKLKVERIVLNLVSNSIKYTPEGGTIKISFLPGPKEYPAGNLSLSIEDNGIGMEPEFMEHMFEPFTQEKRAESSNVQGTGLGLSIVKHYVELMHGKIDVKSTLNEGTRWVISLPIQNGEQGTAETMHTDALKNFAGKKILVCEDNQMNMEIVTAILHKKGIDVEQARNGKEGIIKFLGSHEKEYDAIFMDMYMPIMDGVSAVKLIRAAERKDAKTVPIIAMSADVFEKSVQNAKKAGMNGYVSKPIDTNHLFAVLAELLDTKKAH